MYVLNVVLNVEMSKSSFYEHISNLVIAMLDLGPREEDSEIWLGMFFKLQLLQVRIQLLLTNSNIKFVTACEWFNSRQILSFFPLKFRKLV